MHLGQEGTIGLDYPLDEDVPLLSGNLPLTVSGEITLLDRLQCIVFVSCPFLYKQDFPDASLSDHSDNSEIFLFHPGASQGKTLIFEILLLKGLENSISMETELGHVYL